MKILKILHHPHNMREGTKRRTRRRMQSLSLAVTITQTVTRNFKAQVFYSSSLF
jgi:hypothetical protein